MVVYISYKTCQLYIFLLQLYSEPLFTDNLSDLTGEWRYKKGSANYSPWMLYNTYMYILRGNGLLFTSCIIFL